MDHKGWRLDRPQIEAWLAELVGAGKEVYAPVEREGLRMFAAVGAADTGDATPAQVALEEGKTQYSPKEHVFPKTETLFRYKLDADGVTLTDPPADTAERVLFAVRPCDAAGLMRLDEILGKDPFYASRRERTTIVTLGCDQPQADCFCTAVDGAPHGAEGSDVEVLPAPGGVLVRPLTEKGQSLTNGASGKWKEASPDDWKQADERGKVAAATIERQPVAKEWARGLEEHFESEAWNDAGERCLGCSICAYVCPSCSCYDVQDEGGGSCGERCRNWDACSYGIFTKHASGHNPRESQGARYRQRLLHKFSYYPARSEGKWMCVGCGRCVKLCPVGIDIHEAVSMVMQTQRGKNV